MGGRQDASKPLLGIPAFRTGMPVKSPCDRPWVYRMNQRNICKSINCEHHTGKLAHPPVHASHRH